MKYHLVVNGKNEDLFHWQEKAEEFNSSVPNQGVHKEGATLYYRLDSFDMKQYWKILEFSKEFPNLHFDIKFRFENPGEEVRLKVISGSISQIFPST